eukprot:TRINITY_DN22128_c0_g1_i6.p1 TRINITY_DN22128_c0_g1~~TRINITY_DN22128_c0_g1_i6.p1  ORF type:complete len:128 (-),score=12.32 TRINITY_DN22128_c0_g1_i6:16-399(-)
MKDHDCSQNIYAIYAIWGLILACSVACFGVSCFRLKKQLVPWRKDNEGKRFMIKLKSFFHADSLRPALLGLVLGIAWTILAPLRIFHKGEYHAIGQTGIASFLYVLGEIGRAVQQECRDRSRMPSSA